MPLVQAAQNVVPVAVTAGDKIEALRQWASGRCLSADLAGVYFVGKFFTFGWTQSDNGRESENDNPKAGVGVSVLGSTTCCWGCTALLRAAVPATSFRNTLRVIVVAFRVIAAFES